MNRNAHRLLAWMSAQFVQRGKSRSHTKSGPGRMPHNRRKG